YAWLCHSIQLTGCRVLDSTLRLHLCSSPWLRNELRPYFLVGLQLIKVRDGRTSPSLSIVRGFQSSRSWAREMSGRRWRGSSSGRDRGTMRECERVKSITIVADSTIENHVELQLLTGPGQKSTARARRWTPSCRRGKCGDHHVYRTVPVPA